MAESKDDIQVQPIYDAARECVRLFDKYPQEPKDNLREIISVNQKRFRSWAAYLGVFSHKRASLDMRLRFEPEIRDLTMLLLDVLQTDLRRVIKLSSRRSLSRPSTLSEPLPAVRSPGEPPLPLSGNAKGALSGIVGSIDRLQRLAVRIRASSRDDQKLEQRVVDFAKQLLPDGSKDLIWMILKYKFPNAEEGLITKLTESIIFRRHRLLYQRHHYKKLSYVRHPDTVEDDQQLPSMPKATGEASEHDQNRQSATELANPKKAEDRRKHAGDAPRTEVVSSTNPTNFRRDRFDQHEDEKRRLKAPTVFSVGSSWVGQIDYPQPPSLEGDSDYVTCQFCFQELNVVDNEDPKWWERHVDKDMDHYICISDECYRSLYYFDSFKVWLRHMDSEHETDWPRFIYPKNIEWRCTLSEDHGDSFLDVESLEKHLKICHPDDFDPDDLQLIIDNSSFPQPREPDLCPLCHESINGLMQAVEEKPVPEKPRKAVVKFEDQTANSGEERGDTKKNIQPAGKLVLSDNSSLNMEKHIAKHLKSVSFLSLRGLEPYDEDEQEGSSREELRGSDRSALNDSIASEYIRQDSVDSISSPESWSYVLGEPRKGESTIATKKVGEVKLHDKYTVGWVCALSNEQIAAITMLDRTHPDLPNPPNDQNTYTLGSIGNHNIVIACLPDGEMGTNSAATVATQMFNTFPSIRFGFMVGISGGVPSKAHDIRLGDVVVSTPSSQFPGVVQWNAGKMEEGGHFNITRLKNPPRLLLRALKNLSMDHKLNESRMPKYLDELEFKQPRLAGKYLRSGSLRDLLFRADYGHVANCEDGGVDNRGEEESCKFCDKTKIVKRRPRDMRIHYGLIASGDQIIKDAAFQDRLNKDLGGNVLCVDMEAAGLMDIFPCIVIRGICDYADSHKNTNWQEHAAVVAAAFAKELLQYVKARMLMESVFRRTHTLKERQEILDWLTPIDYGLQQSDYLRNRQEGTNQWFFETQEFQGWLATNGQTLFCSGTPGAGKAILMSAVVGYLNSRFRVDPKVGLAYIYCNLNRKHEQGIHNLIASVLKQLAQRLPSIPDSIKALYKKHKPGRTRPWLDEILSALDSVAATFSSVFILVDALDECRESDNTRTKFLSELFNLQQHKANIFVTSRPILNIFDHFKTSVSIEVRTTSEDVERYLTSHIGQLQSLVQQDQQLQEEIKTVISEAAGGVFLLVHLYHTLLVGCMTKNDIRSKLDAMRKHSQESGTNQNAGVLTHLYDQVMTKINNQMPELKMLAIRVLSWITCAKRPLTTVELQHAVAIKTESSGLDPRDIPDIGIMVSICAGLVTVDEESNIIRLIHSTTQEYFERTRQTWFLDAEAKIAKACVTYLSFDIFKTGGCESEEFDQRLQSNPLYDYASRNWGHHASKDMTPNPTIINFLESQAHVDASAQALMSDKMWSEWYTAPGMTGLHLAGYFNLIIATETLLARGRSPNTMDAFHRTPLSYAAERGHETIVELLLCVYQVDVDPVDELGKTPLSYAIENEHETIVMLLRDTLAMRGRGEWYGTDMEQKSAS